MSLFYKASSKELLEIRRKLFFDKGAPVLYHNGFGQSPFSTSWFGRNNLGDHDYEFCKITEDSLLEIITVYISRRNKWVRISLNIFKLESHIKSLEQLKGIDGMPLYLPTNKSTDMRFHSDDVKGPPLFNYNFMFRAHKLKKYFIKSGLERNARSLGNRIAKDLGNLNYFINRWKELHKPAFINFSLSPNL
jgi:hypothetical protein